MASEAAEREAEASGEAASADDPPDKSAVDSFGDDTGEVTNDDAGVCGGTDEPTDDRTVDSLRDEASFERCTSASSTSPVPGLDAASLGASDTAEPAFGADDAALSAAVSNGVPGGDERAVARGDAAAAVAPGGHELGTLGKERSESFLASGGAPEVRSSSVLRATGWIGFTSGAKSGEAA